MEHRRREVEDEFGVAEVVLDSSAVLGLVLVREGSSRRCGGDKSIARERCQRGRGNQRTHSARRNYRGRSRNCSEACPTSSRSGQRLAQRAGALWRDLQDRAACRSVTVAALPWRNGKGLPVLTSDRRWADLSIGVEVRLCEVRCWQRRRGELMLSLRDRPARDRSRQCDRGRDTAFASTGRNNARCRTGPLVSRLQIR